MRARARIAVVGNDSERCHAMVQRFCGLGYECWSARSAEVFFRELAIRGADIAVLDVELVGEGGVSITRHLKRTGEMGVILLSRAETAMETRVEGIRAGADALLVLPIDLRELAAYIEVSWKRRNIDRRGAASPGFASPHTEQSGRWSVDTCNWLLVSPLGKRLPLTSAEFRLIRCMNAERGTPVAREFLASALWGAAEIDDTHRLDALFSRLRRKTATLLNDSLPIRTVRGFGFVFEDADTSVAVNE